MIKLSVSLWSADLTKLGEVVREIERYADYFHFDVADGHFVSSLLFFPDLIKSLRVLTSVPFEVHCAVEQPEKFITPFLNAGANILAIHPQTCKDPEKAITTIKKHGLKASVVLDYDKPTEHIKPFLRMVDYVVVMGTPAGIKEVQELSLLPKTCTKIQKLKKLLLDLGAKDVQIEVDGAIRKQTVSALVRAGADIVVLGSLFFDNEYNTIAKWLRSLQS